jgi:hypothetical protein
MASPTTAGPTHRVQSAVEVYGFPRGHLGHLSPEEEEALTDFKLLCEQNGYYSPGNGSTEAPSHEDATLLSRLHHLSGYIVADRCQTVSSSTSLRRCGSLEAISYHRGLAQGNSARSTIRDHRYRALRRDSETCKLQTPQSRAFHIDKCLTETSIRSGQADGTAAASRSTSSR